MSQPVLTESPDKTKQRIKRREPRPDFVRPFQGGPHPILHLQRTLGNQRVAQLIKARRLTPDGRIIGLQPKLTVGAADDQYEQEADRVARQVASMPDSVAMASLQQAPQVEGEANQTQTLQSKPLPLAASITPFVQRQLGGEEAIEEEKDQEEDKEELLQAKFFNKSAALPLQNQVLQTMPLAASIAPFAQRQTENNELEDHEPPVQAKFLSETDSGSLQRQTVTEEEEPETIQAKSAASLSDSFETDDDVESRLSQSKGSGSQLPDPVRTYMEPRFGVDFSHVNVHTGSNAAQMNQAIGAQAFTHGSDIYYGAGSSPNNLELTAHELTHVVQQTGHVPLQTKLSSQISLANSSPSVHRKEKVSDRSDSISSAPQDQLAKLSRSQGIQSAQGNYSLQLQRYYGNHYVQDVIFSSQRSKPLNVGIAKTSSERHEPLDSEKAQHFGKRLGADFTSVTIHTGDDVAEDHNAAAVTFGNDIHFADGMVDAGGDTLLGHELVHTVQQGAVPTGNGAPIEAANTEATEAEANRLGAAAARGVHGTVRLAAPRERQLKPQRPSDADDGGKGEDPLAAVDSLQKEARSAARATHPVAAVIALLKRPQSPDAVAPGSAAGVLPARAAVPAAGAPGAAVKQIPTAPTAAPAAGGIKVAPAISPAHATAPTAGPGAALIPRPPRPVPATLSPNRAMLPDIPDSAPSAELGRMVIAEGAQLASQIRQTVAAAVASIRACAQEQAGQLLSEQAANAAVLANDLSSGQSGLAAREQATVSKIQGSRQGAQTAVTAAGQAGTEQTEQAGQRERQRAPQIGDQASADFEASATAESRRFREGSNARAAQAQTPADIGGDSADAQTEASERIGSQVTQNFDQDADSVEGGTNQVADELLGYLQQGVSSFLGAIEQTLPQITSGITSLVETARGGFDETGTEASSSVSAFAAQANQSLADGIAAAQGDLERGTQMTVVALQTGAERYAAEIEARGAELADSLEQRASSVGVMITGMPTEQAQQAAQEMRAQLQNATVQASTQLGTIDTNVTGSITQHATAASGEMAQATDKAGSQIGVVTTQVGQNITAAGAQASEQLAMGARMVSHQIQQTSIDTAAEFGQQGTDFATSVQQGTGQAQQQLATMVNQAETDQVANLGTFEERKSSTVSEISTQYDSLKSEADSRSESERNSQPSEGQAFLEWILPDTWTKAIRQWFADVFGNWLGGFLYGVINAVIGILVVVGIAAIAFFFAGPIGAAIVIGGALLLGIIGGIYSRFTMFEAYNGRGPGVGEGIGLVLLGILDISGVPQIIEGLVGCRAFSNGHEMKDFEAGEAVGSGVVQLIALIILIRGAKGSPPPEVRPPPEEVRPPPEEVRPPEELPPATGPRLKVTRNGNSVTVEDANTGATIGLGELDGAGYISYAIYTSEANTTIRGGEVFTAILSEFRSGGATVRGVRGLWHRSSDNLTTFNNLIRQGLTPEEAALQTFTGKMAGRNGYPRSRIDYANSPRNPDGTFQRAEVYFEP